MTNEEREAVEKLENYLAKRGHTNAYPYKQIRTVLDALEEAQTVKTAELFKALDDERRRVGEEILTGPRHELCETVEERVRRICRVEEDGDE